MMYEVTSLIVTWPEGDEFNVGEPHTFYTDNSDNPSVVERIVVNDTSFLVTFTDGDTILFRGQVFDAKIQKITGGEAADIVANALEGV